MKKLKALEGVLIRRRVWRTVVGERGLVVQRKDSSRADQAAAALMSLAMVRAFFVFVGLASWDSSFFDFLLGATTAETAEAANGGGSRNTCVRFGGKREVEYESSNWKIFLLTFIENLVGGIGGATDRRNIAVF